MPVFLSDEEQVRQALQQFQVYYTRRDPALVDEFFDRLMDDDLEVIGTNGIRPGDQEWYPTRETAREIFVGDWQSWGDLRLEISAARLRLHDQTAWLSAPATVQMTIPAEKNYADYLNFIRSYMEKENLTAEQKLLYILRGGNNTLFELRRGEDFTWPLRFTAVLVKQPAGWKFRQMQFSFPTIYFPDARILP